jgi:hypothetical protein
VLKTEAGEETDAAARGLAEIYNLAMTDQDRGSSGAVIRRGCGARRGFSGSGNSSCCSSRFAGNCLLVEPSRTAPAESPWSFLPLLFLEDLIHHIEASAAGCHSDSDEGDDVSAIEECLASVVRQGVCVNRPDYTFAQHDLECRELHIVFGFQTE